VLKVDSVYSKKNPQYKKIIITIYPLLILGSYQLFLYRDPIEVFYCVLFVTSILYVLLIMFLKRYFAFGNPLIMTESSIIIGGIIDITYGKIKAYSFNEYEGVRRLSFQKNACGVTLTIYPKGTIGALSNVYGHSLFCLYGYFFKQEEIEKTIELLESKGIKRDTRRDDLLC
jgi:hypothetical protein